MRIDVITILPEMIQQGISHSIVRRAQESGVAEIRVVDLRQYTHDRHRTTDDTPCGGGGGMIMKVEPVAEALDDLVGGDAKVRVLLTDPQGRKFDQAFARELATEEHVVILCGHYEGVDERIRQHLVTDEVSIGDYVLTGGELPALVILDAVTRLQTGALGDEGAPDRDSFADGLLEHPHYTKPREYRGWTVPDILLEGNHALINRWRRKEQLRRTRDRRPDLWEAYTLTELDKQLVKELENTETDLCP
ncbi:MAG: tRNA (guanosine(37)-N1)-methyltransferase TrmD [Chthonomonadales bacterium]